MRPSLQDILNNNPQPEPQSQFVSALETRLRQEATIRQQIHRSKLYRWITSCSSLAACVALLLFLLIPHNSDSFATMQLALRQSDYLSVEVRLEMYLPITDTTIPLSQTQSWVSRAEGIRSDISIFGKPSLQLWHPITGDTLLINHAQQVTTPLRLPGTVAPDELLRFNPSHLIEQISHITGKPTIITSDDPATTGYRIDSKNLQLPDNTHVEVWVNQASNLPTRIVCDIPLHNGTNLLWTADHFGWDRRQVPDPLMPSNPASYKQMPPLTLPTPSLEAVIHSLRNFARHANGNFPNSQTLPWEAAIKSVINVMQQPEQLKSAKLSPRRITGLADALAGGIYLLRAREDGASIHYNGDKVRLGDKSELLRIRHADGTVQTIDGNLNLQVTTP